jgi:antitoxin component YwqK of YwqJK toxin-antitoxin module
MKYLIFMFFCFSITACSNKGANNAAGSIDLTGFEEENVPGANAIKVIKKDQAGKTLEEGFISNGQRTGTWIVYHPDNDRIKSITNYINGDINGYHLEFTNRGQIEFKGAYQENEYNGKVSKYKFGRVLEEFQYNEGELDGQFSIFSDRGKIQRKGSYKKGKQDGLLQYFDDEGNVTLQYEYKNGEKISGGIVEKKEATE